MRAKIVGAGLLMAGVGALGIVSGCGSETPASAAQPTAPAVENSGPVTVTLGQGKEFSVAAEARHTPGKVDFAITNGGKIKHEFVVVRTDKPAGGLGTEEADETGAVDEIADIPVGATKHLKVTLPPGHYVLLCNFPGHYTGGMHADFTVE